MNKTFLVGVAALVMMAASAYSQGTAFTYQGRLLVNGSAFNGSNDLIFRLCTNATAGGAIASVTNNGVPISGGLFTVVLDFGSASFNGTMHWLQVEARTNASGFAVLSPRQRMTPTPGAIYAATAGAVGSNGVGTFALQDSAITAAKIGAAQVVKSLNGLRDSVTLSAGSNVTITPSGNSLQISAQGWGLGGNAGTTPGANYFGASDNAQVRMHATGGFLMDNTTPALSFGNQVRQMLNLWQNSYGIGVQSLTLYNRSEGNFAWHRNGSHVDGVANAGPGGTNLMTLDGNANLFVNGSLVVDNVAANASRNHFPGLLFAGGGGESITSNRDVNDTTNRWGLNFFTGYQNRMAIRNDGFIGINTLEPDHLLDVNGNVAVRGTLLVDSKDQNNGADIPGIIFGSYDSFEVISSQRGTNGPNRYGLDFYTANARRMSVANNGNVGIGTATPQQKLHIAGPYVRVDGAANEQAYLGGDGIGNDVQVGSLNPGVSKVVLWNPAANDAMDLDVRDASVRVLTIRGGADLAEPFPMSSESIAKGSLVIIDENQPGRLKLSEQAYDRRVAGIVSGANGVNPGITLHQEGLVEGSHNVALTGRVFALADTSNGAIKPGDLLTSSSTPGHVMRVTDHARAGGAIVGKSMGALDKGTGFVLVLVSLQ